MMKDKLNKIVGNVLNEFPDADVVKIRKIVLGRAALSEDFNEGELQSHEDYKKALDEMGYPLPD